jgi:hypothetical protein
LKSVFLDSFSGFLFLLGKTLTKRIYGRFLGCDVTYHR